LSSMLTKKQKSTKLRKNTSKKKEINKGNKRRNKKMIEDLREIRRGKTDRIERLVILPKRRLRN
jgi:hypothetical protein